MDIKEVKQQSIKFWDDYFKQYPTFKIQKSDITIDTALDECLKFLGDHCENVIDVGCGEGICLMEIALIGEKVKSCLGFDASLAAVEKGNEIVKLSEIKNIKFEQGDENYLKGIPSAYFDGMVCSNFLDVIPTNLSDVVIKEMLRVIKPKGYILLKFNFLLTPELIEKLHMVEIEKNGSLLLKVDSFFLFHLLVHRFVSFKRSPIIELLTNQRRPIWILTFFYYV